LPGSTVSSLIAFLKKANCVFTAPRRLHVACKKNQIHIIHLILSLAEEPSLILSLAEWREPSIASAIGFPLSACAATSCCRGTRTEFNLRYCISLLPRVGLTLAVSAPLPGPGCTAPAAAVRCQRPGDPAGRFRVRPPS
jgi:hypothetical protein